MYVVILVSVINLLFWYGGIRSELHIFGLPWLVVCLRVFPHGKWFLFPGAGLALALTFNWPYTGGELGALIAAGVLGTVSRGWRGAPLFWVPAIVLLAGSCRLAGGFYAEGAYGLVRCGLEILISAAISVLFYAAVRVVKLGRRRHLITEEWAGLLAVLAALLAVCSGLGYGGAFGGHAIASLALLGVAVTGGAGPSAVLGAVSGLTLALGRSDSLVSAGLWALTGALTGSTRPWGIMGVGVVFLSARLIFYYQGLLLPGELLAALVGEVVFFITCRVWVDTWKNLKEYESEAWNSERIWKQNAASLISGLGGILEKLIGLAREEVGGIGSPDPAAGTSEFTLCVTESVARSLGMLGDKYKESMLLERKLEERLINLFRNNNVELSFLRVASLSAMEWDVLAKVDFCPRRFSCSAMIAREMKNLGFSVVRCGRYWGDGNCRIYLKKGARFNLRTALAQAGRQGAKVTGDRVKLARIGDKAIVSICDGTGTGPRAAQESDGITDVLVGLYQLGLEAMDAVKILNGFWASLCCEEFPSLDVAVVYLQEGYCEFIKLGAPPSFIWGENGLTIVPAGGALLGLDGHRDPFRYGVQLRPGDNVIMVTDGYLSHFGHQELAERLASVMSSRRKKHFVELAEALLECATGVSNGIKDDSTVLVGRLETIGPVRDENGWHELQRKFLG